MNITTHEGRHRPRQRCIWCYEYRDVGRQAICTDVRGHEWWDWPEPSDAPWGVFTLAPVGKILQVRDRSYQYHLSAHETMTFDFATDMVAVLEWRPRHDNGERHVSAIMRETATLGGWRIRLLRYLLQWYREWRMPRS